VINYVENDPDIDVQLFSKELREIINYDQIKFDHKKP